MIGLTDVANWLINSGLLEAILEKRDSQPNFLTAGEAASLLDDTMKKLVARMDEERLRQLGSGLAQLRDAQQSTSPQPLVANALNSFHEIAALPVGGKTGDYDNRELISLANLGLASVYQLVGDVPALIAEKLVQAVAADPDTTQQYLGMGLTNTIHRQLMPGEQVFYLVKRSLSEPDALFPADRSYYVPSRNAPFGHLWVGIRQDGQDFYITDGWEHLDMHQPGCTVGLTLPSALLLRQYEKGFGSGYNIDWGRIIPDTHTKLKQGKVCARLKEFLRVLPPFLKEVAIYAPMSGKVYCENEDIWSGSPWYLPNMAWRDPYEDGWLFQIELNAINILKQIFKPYDEGNVNPQFHQEMGNLLDAAAYRRLIEEHPDFQWALIDSITYDVEGGKTGDRHLVFYIRVVNQLGQPVSESQVKAILLDRKGRDSESYEFESTTDDDGTVGFILEKAQPGKYATQIDEIVAAGLKWIELTPKNKYRK
jgi:glycine cleavage system H lipoate-binding protein